MEMQVETQLSDQIARYLISGDPRGQADRGQHGHIDTPLSGSGMDSRPDREAMTDVDKGRAARPVRVKAVDGLIARPAATTSHGPRKA